MKADNLAPPEAVTRAVAFFENLQPAHLAALDLIYAPDAEFKDPFNEVRGIAGVRGVFEHMFASLEAPHFVVTGRVLQGSECFLTWDFIFTMRRFRRGEPQVIRGASQLVFDGSGRIRVHRDYWDAAEELYEKLPLLGTLMRWLKRRART
ncbi:MAG: nuclear transport factor 2 family protein [Giesbergeria sp.]